MENQKPKPNKKILSLISKIDRKLSILDDAIYEICGLQAELHEEILK